MFAHILIKHTLINRSKYLRIKTPTKLKVSHLVARNLHYHVDKCHNLKTKIIVAFIHTGRHIQKLSKLFFTTTASTDITSTLTSARYIECNELVYLGTRPKVIKKTLIFTINKKGPRNCLAERNMQWLSKRCLPTGFNKSKSMF